jgi:hypothetical protein
MSTFGARFGRAAPADEGRLAGVKRKCADIAKLTLMTQTGHPIDS